MKKFCGCLLGLALAAALASVAPAQEKKAGVMAPPKVLNISREFVKPGKGGPPHDRSESAFVKAMTAAKWPTRVSRPRFTERKGAVVVFDRIRFVRRLGKGCEGDREECHLVGRFGKGV